MASEDGLREKVGRKLTKRRKEPKRVSMDIPERFKDGDDAEEDVTAPKSKETMAMNQSLFSMITRAGGRSQADLRTMHEVDSGDSDEEGAASPRYHSMDGAARLSRLSTIKTWDETAEAEDTIQKDTKHRRGLSEHKLLKSLPRLNITRKASKKGSSSDRMSSSQILPPRSTESEPTDSAPEDILVRQKGKAKAKVLPDSEVKKLPAEPRRGRLGSTASSSKAKGPVTLARRLQEIFEFESLEEVISGSCLSQSLTNCVNSRRISLLALAEHPSPRLYVHNTETHLLLCVYSEETCEPPSPSFILSPRWCHLYVRISLLTRIFWALF